MDNTRTEEVGINILNSVISENCPRIRSSIQKMDKYPIWDGEFLVYQSDVYSNSHLEGRLFVQVKSTSDIEEVLKYKIKKDLLTKYTLSFGVLILRPYSDWKEKPPLISYRFLYPKDIIHYIRKNDNKSCTIELEKIINYDEFLKECLFFINESAKQANTNNMIDFNELSQKGNTTFTLCAPAGFSLDKAIITGKHNLYYKSEGKYDIIVNGNIAKISPELNIDITVDGKSYFKKIIKEVSKENGIVFFFNSSLTMTISTEDIGEKKKVQFNYKYNIEPNIKLADYLEAIQFFIHVNKMGAFCVNAQEIKINQTILPEEDLNTYFNYEKVASLLDLLRIDIDNITFYDITKEENSNIIEDLVNFIISNLEVQSEASNDIFSKNFILFNRTICIFFIRLNGKIFKPIYLNNPSIYDDACQMTTPNNETITVSKFLLLSLIKNVRSIEGFFDEVYDDLILRFDYKVSSQYILFILECINVYDKDSKIDFLNFCLRLIRKIEKIDTKENLNIHFINKMQIIKRMRKLSDFEKEKILSLKEQTNCKIDLLICCNILLDEVENVKKNFDIFKSDDEKNYNIFLTYPIYTLYNKTIESK